MKETKLNNWQWTSLVLMRILIGWHFLYEGIAKLLKGDWSAAGFLLQSKWILSDFFKWIANTPDVLSIVNTMNIWGLIAIGIGLIIGCCTRIAACAGILLVLLYYICNPPLVGLFYSIPMEGSYLIVNKNLVEVSALLVLILIPTQQFIGLDRIFYKWLKRGNS